MEKELNKKEEEEDDDFEKEEAKLEEIKEEVMDDGDNWKNILEKNCVFETKLCVWNKILSKFILTLA